jgi:chemotaxis signal transduction protein
VVLRLGSTLLALPATAVGELLGDAAVQKMPGLGRSFLGMGQWRGHDLPVLDMALLLDLAQPPGDRTPWLLVLHLEARVLAFPVSEIVAVRRFDSASLQSASLLSGAMQAFCQSSCLTQQGERVYLLDAVALLDASPLSNRRQPAAAPADSALRLGHLRQAAAGALVVFKSRQLWAASMGLMREIVKLPPHLQNLQVAPDGASALRGSMEWRGQSITLQDLRMLRDGQPSGLTQEARVMVIQSGSHSVGLLVESVVALIPGHSGTRARFSAHGTWVDMVTVGSGAEQLSYQLMDLSQVAGLAPTAAVAAAAAASL